MKKLIPVELLEKYLSGKCSAREEAFVKEWYQSFEQDDNHIDTLSAIERQQLQEKIYNRVLDNIGSLNTDNIPAPIPNTNSSYTGIWYKAAIIAGLAITVTAAFLSIGNNSPKTEQVALTNDASTELISFTNTSKHIYKSTLPDSSTVWLSPYATLKYPKIFAKAARMVSMTGECFFEVTKNPKRPFIITSRSIITKVWGTSFLVRDNEKGNTADVSVVTGKVSVSIKAKSKNSNLLQVNKDEVMLYPQQKAVYLADANTLKPENTKNTTELKKWAHVNLDFENKSLKDIVPILNATYNVHIVVGSEKLNHYLLNADFSNLNLPDVLEALSKALNIDYALKDNTIILQ